MTFRTTPTASSGANHARIDGSAGVAGDMLLGALVDAGADLGAMQAMVDAVIPPTIRLDAAVVARAGLRALRVHVHVRVLVPDQPHHAWSQIRTLPAAAPVPDAVRARALTAFGMLADAEAHVHGIGVDDVHFHEVGAWDSIADIVGVSAALHRDHALCATP
jgi:uncharacterized protein (DUF111 family)